MEFIVYSVDLARNLRVVKTLHCDQLKDDGNPDLEKGGWWHTHKLIIDTYGSKSGSVSTEIEINEWDFSFNEPFHSILENLSKKY